jgi:hypothetical protein
MILNETKESVREQLTGLLRTIELPWQMVGEIGVKGSLPYFTTEFDGTKIEVHPKKVRMVCVHEHEDGECENRELEIVREIKTGNKQEKGGSVYKDSLLYRQLYLRFMDENEVAFLRDVKQRVLKRQEQLELIRQQQEEADTADNMPLKIAREHVKQLEETVNKEVRENRKLIKEKKELEQKLKSVKKMNATLMTKRFGPGKDIKKLNETEG